MYSETNMSLGKISDQLNENKILAPNGGLWDSCKISRILRNPIYVKADADIYLYFKNKKCTITNDISEFIGLNGCYLYGRREPNERKFTNVEGDTLSIGLHEGMIDSKTWLLCQYKLDKNKQIKNSGKGKYSWLSGIVKCGYCLYAVSVTFSGGNKYFHCRGKTNYKICNGYTSPRFVEKIEDYVKEQIFQKAKELKDIAIITDKTDNGEINKIKLQIIDIENQIKNLINQMAQSSVRVNQYINDTIDSLDFEKTQKQEELNKISINNNTTTPIKTILEYINMWDLCDIEKKKQICQYFIDRVLIKDDETIINWKY